MINNTNLQLTNPDYLYISKTPLQTTTASSTYICYNKKHKQTFILHKLHKKIQICKNELIRNSDNFLKILDVNNMEIIQEFYDYIPINLVSFDDNTLNILIYRIYKLICKSEGIKELINTNNLWINCKLDLKVDWVTLLIENDEYLKNKEIGSDSFSKGISVDDLSYKEKDINIHIERILKEILKDKYLEYSDLNKIIENAKVYENKLVECKEVQDILNKIKYEFKQVSECNLEDNSRSFRIQSKEINTRSYKRGRFEVYETYQPKEQIDKNYKEDLNKIYQLLDNNNKQISLIYKYIKEKGDNDPVIEKQLEALRIQADKLLKDIRKEQ